MRQSKHNKTFARQVTRDHGDKNTEELKAHESRVTSQFSGLGTEEESLGQELGVGTESGLGRLEQVEVSDFGLVVLLDSIERSENSRVD
mmetsp:Transcript_17428/g.21104  ORF Transcript_17428/g.21104 Transcript_17428/m.21104 type:complete len:89 (+) Transcript_17428:435-701(+)